MPTRNLRLDALKGLAIVAVIVLHSVPRTFLDGSFAAFHIWQAVPVFLVLLGYNAARSAARRGVTYDAAYWRSRWERIARPAVLVIALGAVLAAIFHQGDHWALLVIGRMPAPAPGNYFVLVAIQFAILWPLLWRAWQRSPLLTTVALLGLEAAFLLSIKVVEPGGLAAQFVIRASILHYLGFIAGGMWLARTDRWVPVAALVAVGYLLAFHLADDAWLTDQQNLLAAGYAVLLVLVALKALPSPGPLVELGKASYEIFLVQMLVFAFLIPQEEPEWLPLTLALSCAVGWAWWWLENRRLADRGRQLHVAPEGQS